MSSEEETGTASMPPAVGGSAEAGRGARLGTETLEGVTGNRTAAKNGGRRAPRATVDAED